MKIAKKTVTDIDDEILELAEFRIAYDTMRTAKYRAAVLLDRAIARGYSQRVMAELARVTQPSMNSFVQQRGMVIAQHEAFTAAQAAEGAA